MNKQVEAGAWDRSHIYSSLEDHRIEKRNFADKLGN